MKYRSGLSSLDEALNTVRELIDVFGPGISCERTDRGWMLDPDDEDDRNASYVTKRSAVDMCNPVHRDLLLDALIALAPVPGGPAIPDVEKLYVLKQVSAAKQRLSECKHSSSNKAAFAVLAAQNRALDRSRQNPLGKMGAKTIERRFYSAAREIRKRLPSERFQRNYSCEELAELKKLVSPPKGKSF